MEPGRCRRINCEAWPQLSEEVSGGSRISWFWLLKEACQGSEIQMADLSRSLCASSKDFGGLSEHDDCGVLFLVSSPQGAETIVLARKSSGSSFCSSPSSWSYTAASEVWCGERIVSSTHRTETQEKQAETWALCLEDGETYLYCVGLESRTIQASFSASGVYSLSLKWVGEKEASLKRSETRE